ncbi:fat-like cadherin-related tumor suppressor homolog [Oratosquilla oratoria]|uniref:fat-like cadherin-related tumor suppressor homolog n=1 Tax=Oratosquilla oratoria TaxID=337810 RepID=UPI003F75E24E
MGAEEVEAEAVVVRGEKRVGGLERQLRRLPGGSSLPLLVVIAALALLGPETAAATTAASSSSYSSSAAAPTLSPLAPFEFKKDSYFATIYENSLPRTYVVSEELIGIPLDAVPPGAYVVYSIENGDPDNFFTSEAEEVGGLSVLHVRTRTGAGDVLNRERRDRYNLKIVGQVRGHQGVRVNHLSAQTNLSIQVVDINDNMPLFYPNEYSVTAGEDASLHSTLVTVAALDADAGPNGEVYYSLANADTNNFAVHPTTGVVSLTRPLIFTRTSLHRLTVLAKDRGPSRRNSRSSGAAEASVEVRVKQVNNHDPRIIVQHLPSIVEHAHTYIYAILTVHDDDKGPSGRVSKVEIVSGDPDRLFSITRGSTSTEFNLAVLRLLDRELAPKGYNLTLRAADDGIPKRTTHTNVHVNIADVNDHAPVFAREQYEVFVSEEAPPNTPVVRVAALDTDQGPNGRVVFRLVAGNEAKRFSINANTGLISTADWLDAETTAYYSLTVAALDQASNARRKQSSAKVVIRVSDANDNPPQFSTPNTEVTLDENEPVGSYVTRVVAADNDSGENGFISYSIANLDQVPFSIDPFDGTIKTTAILDYEAQRRIYTIKVRASDWGTPFKRETETTVKVKVRDVNDNRPQFEGIDCAGWVSLDAPVGTSVLTLSALDLDADSVVSYRLTGGHEDGCWALDATAGVLALTCDLRSTIGEGERPQPRIVNVTATDGLHTSDVTSVTLAVVAQRGGDVVTTGNQPFISVECQDTGIRSKVAEVVAAATENNAAVEHYALLPPRYGYNTHVPELSSTIPESIEILEDSPIGTELLTVAATDRDPGHNGRVVYAVAGGDVDSVFRIDVATGVLQLWAPLDREKTAQYVLNISVYDLGVPHLSSSKNVTVRVLDVNDNPPEFTRVSYSLHLPENTRNGTSVAQLRAIDPDEGLNAQVTYELVTDAPQFLVDKNTGVLYVTGTLDRERRAQYDLRVRAWDSAPDNHLTALAIVHVSIIDMNDCAPDFGAARELMIGVPEDLPLGAVVATFHATDDDLGVGGKVSYSLTNGHENTFRIDPETGVVRIAKKIDYEKRQVYNVTVRAQDGGHPALFAHAHLLVQVHDVDENMSPPSFPERVLRAWVKENNPPGTYVTTLKARDPEGGVVTYTITGGEGLGLFSIDNEDSVILPSAPFLSAPLPIPNNQTGSDVQCIESPGRRASRRLVLAKLFRSRDVGPTPVPATVSALVPAPVLNPVVDHNSYPCHSLYQMKSARPIPDPILDTARPYPILLCLLETPPALVRPPPLPSNTSATPTPVVNFYSRVCLTLSIGYYGLWQRNGCLERLRARRGSYKIVSMLHIKDIGSVDLCSGFKVLKMNQTAIMVVVDGNIMMQV